MQHFYFKYMVANEGIDRLIKFYDKKSLMDLEGQTFPVSIYFGKWKAEQLDLGLAENPESQSADQIKVFYELAKVEFDNYLWLFFKDKILQTKVVGTKVFNGHPEFVNKSESLPKSIDVQLVKVHNKIDLPESFSNINSNQGYNRKTITKLKNTEEIIAKSISENQLIDINMDNILDFLSPTEFETLLFLIFSNKDVICSSYRGGTLKDYDLRIKVFNNFHGISIGAHWVQIKYKKNYKPIDDTLTVCLNDKTDLSKNILGIDWLNQRILESSVVSNWIENMIFDYSIYRFNGIK